MSIADEIVWSKNPTPEDSIADEIVWEKKTQQPSSIADEIVWEKPAAAPRSSLLPSFSLKDATSAAPAFGRAIARGSEQQLGAGAMDALAAGIESFGVTDAPYELNAFRPLKSWRDLPARAEEILLPAAKPLKSLFTMFRPKAVEEAQSSAAAKLRKGGDWWREQAATGIEAPTAEDQAPFSEAPLTWLAARTGESLPLFAAATAATWATKNPMYAAAIFGAQQYGDTYRQAREKGDSIAQANSSARVDSAVTQLLEGLPFAETLKESFRPRLVRAFLNAGTESAEEVIQQLWSNGLAATTYDPSRKLSEGVGASGAVGGILGFGAGATSPSLRPPSLPSVQVSDRSTRAAQAEQAARSGVESAIDAAVEQNYAGAEGSTDFAPVSQQEADQALAPAEEATREQNRRERLADDEQRAREVLAGEEGIGEYGNRLTAQEQALSATMRPPAPALTVQNTGPTLKQFVPITAEQDAALSATGEVPPELLTGEPPAAAPAETPEELAAMQAAMAELNAQEAAAQSPEPQIPSAAVAEESQPPLPPAVVTPGGGPSASAVEAPAPLPEGTPVLVVGSRDPHVIVDTHEDPETGAPEYLVRNLATDTIIAIPESAVKPQEANNASGVRQNQGRLGEAGNAAQKGEGNGGENLQLPPKAEPEAGRTVRLTPAEVALDKIGQGKGGKRATMPQEAAVGIPASTTGNTPGSPAQGLVTPQMAVQSPEQAVAAGQKVKLPVGTVKVRATFSDARSATVEAGDLDTLANVGRIVKLEPLGPSGKPVKGKIVLSTAGKSNGKTVGSYPTEAGPIPAPATTVPPPVQPAIEPAAEPKAFPANLAKRLLALPHEQRAYPFGDYNASLRQDVIEAVTGQRPPKSKAGATAVRETLAAHFGVPKGAIVDVERGIIAGLENASTVVPPKRKPGIATVKVNETLADFRNQIRIAGVKPDAQLSADNIGGKLPPGIIRRDAVRGWDQWLETARSMGLISDDQLTEPSTLRELLTGKNEPLESFESRQQREEDAHYKDLADVAVVDEIKGMDHFNRFDTGKHDLKEDALVRKDGKWYKTRLAKRSAILEDDVAIRVADGSAVRNDGVLHKGDTGYDAALAEYTYQERTAQAEHEAEQPIAEPVNLALEQQTPKDVAAEQARVKARKAHGKMLDEAAAPLTGTAGDMTGDMFDRTKADMPLFAVPEPQQRAQTASAQSAVQPVTQQLDEIAALSGMRREGSIEAPGDRATLSRNGFTVEVVGHRGLKDAEGKPVLGLNERIRDEQGNVTGYRIGVDLDTGRADTVPHEVLGHIAADVLTPEQRLALRRSMGLDSANWQTIDEEFARRVGEDYANGVEHGTVGSYLRKAWDRVKTAFDRLMRLKFGDAWDQIKRLPDDMRYERIMGKTLGGEMVRGTSQKTGNEARESEAGAQYDLSAEESEIEAVRRLSAEMQSQYGFLPELEAVKPHDGPTGKAYPLGSPGVAELQNLASLFGKRITFFYQGSGPHIAGAMDSSTPSRILINITTDRPGLVVLGHELAHHLEYDAPDLFARMANEIGALVQNFPDYKKYRGMYDAGGESEYRREFLSDVVGGQFADSKFWNRLAVRNPSLFQRIANSISKFIDTVLAKVNSQPYSMRRYLGDIYKARDVIAEATEKYAARQKGNAQSPDIRFQRPVPPTIQGVGREEGPERDKSLLNRAVNSGKMLPDAVVKIGNVGPSMTYEQMRSKDQFREVRDWLDADPNNVREADLLVRDDSLTPSQKVMTAAALLDKYQALKDGNAEHDLISYIEPYTRDLGRAIQSLSFIYRMSRYGWESAITKFFQRHNITISDAQRKQLSKTLKDAYDMPTGKPRDDAMAAAINDIAKLAPPTWADLFRAYTYQNILSNPKAHERNIWGNVLNAAVVRPAALLGRGDVKGWANYVHGSMTAMQKARDAARNAWNEYHSTKFDDGTKQGDTLEEARMTHLPKALTFVQRAMRAQDEFFSEIIKAGEIARLTKTGMALEQAAVEAQQLADKYLFRERIGKASRDTSLNIFSRAIDSLGVGANQFRNLKGVGPAVQVFIKFVTTPTNIARLGVDMSPLALTPTVNVRNGKLEISSPMAKNNIAKARYRKAYAELTATEQRDVDVEAAERIGLAAIGTVATATAALMAAAGRVTWDPPEDEKERELFYASGKKPYSVQIGDKWVPMWTFGPFALAAAIPAAAQYAFAKDPESIGQEWYQRLGGMGVGLVKFFLTQTPVTVLGDVMNMLSGQEGYKLSRTIGFTATQFLPFSGAVRYVNQWLDPYYRKPKGAKEAIMADIPYLSQRLDTYKNPDGTPAERQLLDILPPYSIGVSDPEFERKFDDRDLQMRNRRHNDVLTEAMIKEVKAGRDDIRSLIVFLASKPPEESTRLRQRVSAAGLRYGENFGGTLEEAVAQVPEGSTLAEVLRFARQRYDKAISLGEVPQADSRGRKYPDATRRMLYEQRFVKRFTDRKKGQMREAIMRKMGRRGVAEAESTDE